MFLDRFRKIFVSFVLLFCGLVWAEEFVFKYGEGDSYRILSTVDENVYYNGFFSHHADIVNRISVNVKGVDEEGNAVHDATFMTSEASYNKQKQPVFSWGEEYRSIFSRSKYGVFDIGDEYFMPVVRDVPIFPERNLSVGDTWTAEGHEAHDLRRVFALDKPFKVPFTVKYKYLGTVTQDGKTLHKISARYTMDFKNTQRPADRTMDYPLNTMGYSNQTIYWNNEIGAIDHYDEEFRIVIETAYGIVGVFEGTAKAEVTEYIKTDNAVVVEDIESKLKEMGVDNTQVMETEKGITISIENIQFKPDSAVLQESEKLKLQKISELLKAFPDNDLLITGHTAMAGTQKARQELSEQRAAAVAGYLIELGVKDAYHIFSQGLGGDKPIADNSTEEGKARNRRVEITILNK